MKRKLLIEIIDEDFYKKLKEDKSQKFKILEDISEFSELNVENQLEIIYNAFKSLQKLNPDIMLSYLKDKTKIPQKNIIKILNTLKEFGKKVEQK